jgi:hypothetical protein
MTLKDGTFTAGMMLACAIVMGNAVNGHSQETSATPRTSMVKEPMTQQSPMNRRSLVLGLEVIADLTVDPPTYTGPCPGAFTLKGQIYVNKPITIQYRFVGTGTPPSLTETLEFEAPGRKEVTYVRRMGDGATMPQFSGAAIIQVVWPVKVDSNAVLFTGSCTGEGLPPKFLTPPIGPERQPVK